MNHSTSPFLSVIIPCRNEENNIPLLLQDLVSQTTQDFEVIVADSASSDNTAREAKKFGNQLTLHTIRVDQPGVALARNTAARHARGDFLLFIDADIRLESPFIAALVSALRARKLDVAGFRQKLVTQAVGLRLGAAFMNSYVQLMSHTRIPIFFSCFVCRRSLHESIEGFDTTLYIMEDYDYALRAKRAGGRFGIIKDVPFLASARRYENNGGGAGILKGVYGELYRYTHGLRVEKPIYTYTMGGKSANNAKKPRK